MIKPRTIYIITGILALLELLNYSAGNAIGHFIYGLPFYFEDFIFNFVIYSLVIFLTWKNFWISLIVFLLYNLYDYWSSYTWGLSGFLFKGQHLQPLLSIWLAMFSIVFCLVGGIYLIMKGKK